MLHRTIKKKGNLLLLYFIIIGCLLSPVFSFSQNIDTSKIKMSIGDSVNKEIVLSAASEDNLLALIKNEEKKKNVVARNVRVCIIPGSNGKFVAKQIIDFLKSKGYNVDDSFTNNNHPEQMDGISITLYTYGMLYVYIGNIK